MFALLKREGTYFRVADPQWRHPLDGTFSMAAGGRWNPPDSFPVVYLCGDIAVAKANVARKFQGLPYGVEDLEPREAPVLVHTTVRSDHFVDVITDDGCHSAGLPSTYPRNEKGDLVSWSACRSVGQRAWNEAHPGIACRSAATEERGEELAWFQRDHVLEPDRILEFEWWFWN